ncbi:hypothetical protein EON65_43660 [archaeon]|nr:MAG: hypothetical protein EON65_43660 [archaeon]
MSSLRLRELQASVLVTSATVPAFVVERISELLMLTLLNEESCVLKKGCSDKVINDPNLKSIVSTLAALCMVTLQDQIGVLQFRTFLPSRTKKPEHHLAYRNCLLVASEAKGM